MDHQAPPKQRITGQVSWNSPADDVESMVPRGPLTGKPVVHNDTPAVDVQADKVDTRRTSRRQRKSEGAFRTISEVADVLDVQQHVLRFWETKFSQVRPLKRGGGRRYYRPEDLVLLQKIHHLLYVEGYTIKGVQKLLKEQGKKALLADMPRAQAANVDDTADVVASRSAPQPVEDVRVSKLKSVLSDLKDMRQLLKAE